MDDREYAQFAKMMSEYFAEREADATEHGFGSARTAAEVWHNLLGSDRRDPVALTELDMLMRRGELESHGAWRELRVFYEHWRGDRPKITSKDGQQPPTQGWATGSSGPLPVRCCPSERDRPGPSMTSTRDHQRAVIHCDHDCPFRVT